MAYYHLVLEVNIDDKPDWKDWDGVINAALNANSDAVKFVEATKKTKYYKPVGYLPPAPPVVQAPPAVVAAQTEIPATYAAIFGINNGHS
jgi:hypothetical protein